MACDTVQQFLLDCDWDANRRREIAEMLRHAEQCDECRAALKSYDALRRVCGLGNDPPPEPAGGWDAMEQRLADTLRPALNLHIGQLRKARDSGGTENDRGRRTPDRKIPPRHLWLNLDWALAAVVAFALAGVGGFALSRFLDRRAAQMVHRGGAPSTRPTAPRVAPFSPPEVARAARKFRDVSRIGYEGRAGWMLVSQSESPVGVIPIGAPLTKKVLLLRLMLMRENEMVSDTDLMVRAGQAADLTVPLADGESLRYRIGTSLDNSTHLTLRLDLNTPEGGEPLALLGTNLQVRPGQNVTAGRLATSGGEYELNIEFASAELAEDKP